MANLRAHRDENGKITAYYIRVYRGRDAEGQQLKPFSMVFDVSPTWSETTARKRAEAAAAVFEEQCKSGLVSDSKQTFSEYAKYVLELKVKNKEIKHSTYIRYLEFLERINPEIGYYKLKDLTAQQLNKLYIKLKEDGSVSETATAKIKLSKVIADKKLGSTANTQLLEDIRSGKPLSATRIANYACIAQSTVSQMLNGESVKKEKAEAVSAVLGYPVDSLFSINAEIKELSNKTILEHHHLISSILTQAEKESLVATNVAAKASPPKVIKKEVEFYEPEMVKRILQAIDNDPIYWETLAKVIIYSGARRGEILGLRHQDIDFLNKRIYICQNLQYAADIGIYIDTTKTTETRWVSLPDNVINRIQDYMSWKKENDIILSDKWKSSDLLFVNFNGDPYHPDSVTDWFANLEKKYDLPHIHPHAFRHSIASALIFNKVDPVSVSKRLGHANVSTTTNIYAHVFAAAEKQNSDIISSLYG